MLRFLHGGDFHLDSPFRSLPPKLAAKARGEQRQLLERFGRLAKEEGIDLVFLTGDIFDGERIYPETMKAFREMLEEIDAPVFIAPGNHDPFTSSSPYQKLSWPSHVHIFSSESVESVELPDLGCTVHGAAFLSSHRQTSPLESFSAKGRGIHLGCFHGEITQGLSRYGPISPSQISDSNLHYLALGHVHAASGLSQIGSTYYAYCGCPQGRGFDETGKMGVFIGTTDGRNLGLQFYPIAQRQYHSISVNVTDKTAEKALQELLPDSPSDDIVRFTFTGERDGHEPLNLPGLHKLALASYFSVTMVDQTSISADLWSQQTEDTLIGLFLREMHKRLEAASPEERATLELSLRFGLAALEGREAPE